MVSVISFHPEESSSNNIVRVCLLSSFPHYKIQYIDVRVDGVLGTRTQGGKMEGADESAELWRHPNNIV